MDPAILKLSDIPASMRYVVDCAKDVSVHSENLPFLVERIQEKHKQHVLNAADAFGTTGTLEKDINIIFFQTAANFCFWAQNEADRWKVTFNGEASGGWYGFSKVFRRAMQEGIPVFEASFMSRLTLQHAEHIFRGDDGKRIPLLEARVNNIIESATFLERNHKGDGLAFLQTCNMSAPQIVEAVVQHLPSYRDGAWYRNRWVWILKRAQILPSDLAQLCSIYPEFSLTDVDRLTAFADYRLPQVLRHYGILTYSKELASVIDSKSLLPSAARAEIEIRAATIVACESMRNICTLSAPEIDLALWLISQDVRDAPDLRPHHLTVSTNY